VRAQILPPTSENLELTARALREGAVIGMPTETVYGLAGNALDPLALARIFEAKERPTFDPLIVHVPITARGLGALEALKLVDVRKLGERARDRTRVLIDRFWPGPLTLVLPKQETVPDLATSGLPTVAVRMPRHRVAQSLIALAGVPLAAPSANRFGRISPTTAQAVIEELGDRIDYVIDGGPCEVGLESTVVAIGEDGEITLLRPGGVERAELEAAIGAPLLLPPQKNHYPAAAQAAPGMLESHYAPGKELRLLSSPVLELRGDEPELVGVRGIAIGVLLLAGAAETAAKRLQSLTGAHVSARTLSEAGDLREAAHHLFAELRALDASPAQLLFVEPCREQTGLGHAIADRLQRATAKSRALLG